MYTRKWKIIKRKRESFKIKTDKNIRRLVYYHDDEATTVFTDNKRLRG